MTVRPPARPMPRRRRPGTPRIFIIIVVRPLLLTYTYFALGARARVIVFTRTVKNKNKKKKNPDFFFLLSFSTTARLFVSARRFYSNKTIRRLLNGSLINPNPRRARPGTHPVE